MSSQQPPEPGPDPLAHSVPISLTPTIFLALFCVFIVLFIRVTYFALFEHDEYAVTNGLGPCQAREETQEQDCVRQRQLNASLARVGLNIVTPPRSGVYVPNLIFGNNAYGGRIGAPLVGRHGHDECHNEPVELEAVAVEEDDECRESLSLHGTNTLNTPWSWMA